MDEKITLLKCPFCGGEASGGWGYGRRGYFAWIQCETCGAKTRTFSIQEEDYWSRVPIAACKAWNRRFSNG